MKTKKKSSYTFILLVLLSLCYFNRINATNGCYSNEHILSKYSELSQSLAQSKTSDEIEIQFTDTVTKNYLKENNLDKSLLWANKALKEHADLDTKIKLFRMLSEIYSAKKYYRLAIDYKDSVNITDRELSKIKTNKAVLASKAQFDLQKYKKEIANKEINIRNDRKILYSVLAGILLSILLLLFLLRDRKEKNKIGKIIAERDRNIIELKLQKEIDDKLLLEEKQKIVLLEQQRLKAEVELKTQKISSRALFISGRNEILQDVLKSLSKLPELSRHKTLFQHIRSLKNHIRSDDDWDNFIKHFDEVNQGFIKNLKQKHPDLNSNDIRFISYIYMHLNIKEIAIINNITLEACRKRKERIMIKLNVPDDMSMSDYIQIFS